MENFEKSWKDMEFRKLKRVSNPVLGTYENSKQWLGKVIL